MKKFISILGSTGSIGLTTLHIINKKKNYFTPFVFSSNKNYSLICKQIIKYRPKYFLINDEKTLNRVKKKFRKNKVKIIKNYEEVKKTNNPSITIAAIPGLDGLNPIINSIKFSEKILIANKEAIVCGWNLIQKLATKNNTQLIPVDSEHFSILKLIENKKLEEIKKIYITSSGGPFLNHKTHQLKKIKPKDALKHPKWKMGKKVTIDSSTLVNKLLELIEAQKLFNIPSKKLEVIIHPNSLVHAVIAFKNGITTMLYHPTSMVIPIANAIFDGNLDIDKFYNPKIKHKDKIENLFFQKVDSKKFPIIKLQHKVNEYPSTSIIFNAANEVLVEQFLKRKISYQAIIKGLRQILNDRNYRKYAIKSAKTINQISAIDFWARNKTLRNISND